MGLADHSGLGRFVLVGGLGFVVDATLLSLLVQWQGWPVYPARLASFAGAVLVTWLLNRALVFAPRAQAGTGPGSVRAVGGELARYLSVQGGGVMVNFAVFAALIEWLPRLAQQPVLPLAAASAVALVWNFAGARWWTFGGVRPLPRR